MASLPAPGAGAWAQLPIAVRRGPAFPDCAECGRAARDRPALRQLDANALLLVGRRCDTQLADEDQRLASWRDDGERLPVAVPCRRAQVPERGAQPGTTVPVRRRARTRCDTTTPEAGRPAESRTRTSIGSESAATSDLGRFWPVTSPPGCAAFGESPQPATRSVAIMSSHCRVTPDVAQTAFRKGGPRSVPLLIRCPHGTRTVQRPGPAVSRACRDLRVRRVP